MMFEDYYQNCPNCFDKNRAIDHIEDHFDAIRSALTKKQTEDLEFHIIEIIEALKASK